MVLKELVEEQSKKVFTASTKTLKNPKEKKAGKKLFLSVIANEIRCHVIYALIGLLLGLGVPKIAVKLIVNGANFVRTKLLKMDSIYKKCSKLDKII